MTDSEHLIENMLVALEKGKSYKEIISDKFNAENATRMTMDTAWEVAQYIFYEYIPCRNNYLDSRNEELQEQNNMLRAELGRVAPFLAMHGFPGYSIEKENGNEMH